MQSEDVSMQVNKAVRLRKAFREIADTSGVARSLFLVN